MFFREDYIEKQCKELNKSIKEYLEGTKENYVVLEDKQPLVWAGEHIPTIFGSKQDALSCIQNWVTDINFDEHDNLNSLSWEIITEWEFLYKYCFDYLEELIKQYVYKNGEDDGICKIFFLKDMNGVINLNDGMYTDILNIAIGIDDLLSALISDCDDNYQTFESLSAFNEDIIYNILMQVLDYDM